jgi:hypothetical protein
MKIRLPFALAIALVSLNCSNDFSSRYGIVTVQLQNGQKVYFKREVWGINGDQFVISASPDLCSMPDPEANKSEIDYVYDLLGPPEIYYKSSGDELTLYSTSLAKPPTKTPFPIKIVQKQLQAIEMIELRDKACSASIVPSVRVASARNVTEEKCASSLAGLLNKSQ